MLTAGLGLKPAHFAEALADTSDGLWLEVHPENHLVDGGPRLAWLQAVGERHPLSLHGVSMSLAGLDRPDPSHLLRLSALVQQLNPALVSEHLAWCTWGGQVLPDLLEAVRTYLHTGFAPLQTRFAQRDDVSRVAPGRFIESGGAERVFFVESVDFEGGEVRNVFVSARSRGRETLVVAENGIIEVAPNGDRYIVLKKGRRYEGTPGQLEYRTLEFDSYSIRIESRPDRPIGERRAKALPTCRSARRALMQKVRSGAPNRCWPPRQARWRSNRLNCSSASRTPPLICWPLAKP